MYGCWVCATSLWILQMHCYQPGVVTVHACGACALCSAKATIIATHLKIKEIETSFCKPLPNGAVQKLNTRWGLIRIQVVTRFVYRGGNLTRLLHMYKVGELKVQGCHKIAHQGGNLRRLLQGWWFNTTRFSQGCSDQAQGCHKVCDLVTTLPPWCSKLGISIWDCTFMRSIGLKWPKK